MASAVAFLACSLVSMTLVSVRSRQYLTGKEHLHGSAAWATEEDVRKTGRLDATTGPYIGGFEVQPGHIRYMRDPFDDNILGVAPPGSGKTSGLVLPTLLDNSDWSMFVLDPKEQLHDLSSGYRRAAGNQVFKFAPGSKQTARYNVLAEIRLYTDFDVKDAQNIAEVICHVPGEVTTDSHWDVIAKQFLVGVMLHACYKAYHQERTATMAEIAEMITPSAATHILDSTLPEMVQYAHDPTGAAGWRLPNGYKARVHPVVRAAANAMYNRVYQGEPNREFEGVVSNCAKRLEIYRDPLIAHATSASDFTIEDLVNHDTPVTLYLCVSFGDSERLLALTRLIVTMAFSRLTEAGKSGFVNKWRLLWLLDEFPTLRDLPAIADGLAAARDFGMKFFLIAQTFAQIELAYRKAAVLINNCDVWVAYAPNDPDTRKLLSQQAGKRTVAHRVQTFSGGRYANQKNAINESISNSERELITPDEVGRMRPPTKGGINNNRILEPGDMLVFLRGCNPIFGRQMLYFFDTELLFRSQIPALTSWPALPRKGVVTLSTLQAATP